MIRTFKKTIVLLVSIVITTAAFSQKKSTNISKQTTICNPVNLSYRFCLDTPSRREAADPTMVVFKGEYYLFASKSGGYFHSTDGEIHHETKKLKQQNIYETTPYMALLYIKLSVHWAK